MCKLPILTALPLLLLAVCGCSRGSTPSPEVDAGRQVFGEHCASCHSLAADTVIVGPSLHGVATRARENSLGLDAAAYLRRAIVTPQADTVEGFPDLMPVDFERKLTPEQLNAVIDFLLAQP
jgi:mono/diheme cytochrome c family protein